MPDTRLLSEVLALPGPENGDPLARADAARALQAIGGAVSVQMFGAIADGTQAARNDEAFADAIAYVQARALVNDTIGVPLIVLPAGRYALTNLTFPPWVKFVSAGTVELDFSSMTSGTAIRVTNAGAPAGAATSRNAGNHGPFLSGMGGAIFIKGPGAGTATVALDLGETSDAGDAKDFRDAAMTEVVVSKFGVGLFLRRFSTYLPTFRRLRIEDNGVNIKTDGPLQTNAGERITFDSCTIANGIGLQHECDALDFNFINCSFDYCFGGGITLSAASEYCKISLLACHLEGFSDAGFIASTYGGTRLPVVTLTDCKCVPSTKTYTPGSQPAGFRADGVSTACQPLFRGKMMLKINGLQIGGYRKPYAGAAGMFLCDPSVDLVQYDAVRFTEWANQSSSRGAVLNRNSDFSLCTLAQDPKSTPQPGWTHSSPNGALNMTAVVDSTQVFDGSTASIKLTATGASNYVNFLSDPFPVAPNDRLVGQVAIFGGASAGTVRLQFRFHFYGSARVPGVSVASITGNATLITVTTNQPHGLSVGQVVWIRGATLDAYNVKGVVAVTGSSTTFSIWYAGPATSPAVPATGETLRYEVESLTKLSSSTLLSDDFNGIYGNTDDPNYTGSRGWWAMMKQAAHAVAPPGAVNAKMEIFANNLALGDTIWIGKAVATLT